MEEIEHTKRVNFEIATKMHIRIKMIAAARNITMRRMLTRWILERLKKEESYLEKLEGEE
jgi:plasmid maintenance system killer protein